jgi:hypothetical protein
MLGKRKHEDDTLTINLLYTPAQTGPLPKKGEEDKRSDARYCGFCPCRCGIKSR